MNPSPNNNSFPKFVTDCRGASDSTLTASNSASVSSNGGSNVNVAVSSSGAKGPLPPPPPPPLNLCIVINISHYLTPLSKLIIMAQPLDSTGGEAEREAFLALQHILSILDSGKNEPINVFPFLDKFCRYIGTNFSDFEEMDIFLVWDYLIKLITLVIPPLREIFMGRLTLSLDEHAWHSLTTRCVHSQFSHSVQSLEEFIKLTLQQFDKDYYNDIDLYQHRTSLESIKNYNAIILGRAPEILAFAVESPHLPSSLRFLDALNKNHNKLKPPATIKFPASFNMCMKESNGTATASVNSVPANGASGNSEEELMGHIYDLAAVVTLEGTNCETAQAYYRYVHDPSSAPSNESQVVSCQPSNQWYKGSGATHDLVDASRAIEKNYFHINDNKKVHPRLLIYAKRGIGTILDELRDFVTKAGQLRCKGDAAFEAAETPEHYDEAKKLYEDAIAVDSSLRSVLQDRLNSLEQIERNQKAQSYENQADLSLGKKRFKEACDLYKLAMRSAVVNSPIYARIREKEDYMMRIISLEIANHLTEKGEECLKSGSYTQSRENFAQALKLNPNYIHLQSIIQGIDKLITAQTSAQKVSEANQAMKLGRYKYANQLFLEALSLVPERESALKPILESLVVLMQGEDALMKQRSGLIALEDKKYSVAINLITEAISLLPPESVTEHAFFLCDRAQVYFEMKDYQTSIQDCLAALELRPELAVAYLRLGSAQFEMELYDDALSSYEKAMRYDPSLNDQIKVKIRQVNTAKEIQQRKEREAERARIKEEELKRIEEKRAREEKARKERQEKMQQEQAEKAERTLMQKEEKYLRLIYQKESGVTADTIAANSKAAKESLKEKTKREKLEKEQQKAVEKERIKAEKEKERERLKAEKEAKLREEQMVKELELQKQREFNAEMERAQAKLKEAEREKEAEKERLRMEREKILAEKEKQRLEKEKKKQEEAALKAAASATATAKEEPKGKNKATTSNGDSSKSGKQSEKVVPTVASVVAKSVASVVASTATVVDPDFPTLGGAPPTTILKRAESAPTPSTTSTSTTSTPTAAVAAKSKPNPPAKWASLLSSPPVEEPVEKSRPSSTSTLPAGASNSSKQAAKPASSGGVQEEFPPLFDSNGNELDPTARSVSATPNLPAFDYKEVLEKPSVVAENPSASSSTVASVASSTPTPAVLSSGELKALSKSSEPIPAMQLPTATVAPTQSSVPNTSNQSNNGNNGLGQEFPSFFSQGGSSLLNGFESSSNFGLNILENTKVHPPITTTLLSSPDDSSSLLSNFVTHPTTTTSTTGLHNAAPLTSFSAMSELLVEGSQLNVNSAAFQPMFQDVKLNELDNLGRLGGAIGSNNSNLLGGLEHDPFVTAVGNNRRTNSRFTSLFGGSNDDILGGNLLGSIGSNSAESVTAKDALGGLDNSFAFGSSTGNGYGSLGVGFGGVGSGDIFTSSTPNGLLGITGTSGAETSRLSKILGGFGGSNSTGGGLLDGDSLKHSTNDPLVSLTGSNQSLLGGDPFALSFVDTTSGLIGPSLTGSSVAAAGSSSISGLWMQDSSASNGLLGLRPAAGPVGAQPLGFGSSNPLTSLNTFSLGSSPPLFGAGNSMMQSIVPSLPPMTVSPQTLASQTVTRKYELSELGKRIEDELVTDYKTFPTLQRLTAYKIFLYRWAFNGTEWIEYALTLPELAMNAIQLNGGLPTLLQLSGCEMRLVECVIRNSREQLLVLVRGVSGSMSNLSMQQALDLISNWMTTSYPSPPQNSGVGKSPALLPATAASALSSPKLSALPPAALPPSRTSTPALSGLPPPVSSDPTNTTNKWASLPQSIFESKTANPPGSSVKSVAGTGTNNGAGDFAVTDSMIDALISSTNESEKPAAAANVGAAVNASEGAGKGGVMTTAVQPTVASPSSATTTVENGAAAVTSKVGPNLLKPAIHPGTGVAKRYLEIPAELIGLVIGHGGKKIKELATESGSKVQFKTSKTSEREGKPGVLELQGTVDSVDKAATMVWELLQSVGREYREITGQPSTSTSTKSSTR